jgi:hypothetical protein
MSIVDHAKKELALINEDEEFKKAYLEICEIWAGMGHSGGSHEAALPVLVALLEQQNISPLTDDPAEWEFFGPEIWPPSGVWQNNRNGQAFSADGGKTYYLLSDQPLGHPGPWSFGNATMHTSRPHNRAKQLQLDLAEDQATLG